MALAEATLRRLSGDKLQPGLDSGVPDPDLFVNEGLALRVRRASDVGQIKLFGSQNEAAVDLIGRCLSPRALRARGLICGSSLQITAHFVMCVSSRS